MKTALIFAALVILNSCTGQKPTDISPAPVTPAEHTVTPGKKIFSDSAALENFIRAKGVDDSAAGHLRAFYKPRHYQLAWFTEEGEESYTMLFWNMHNTYIRYFSDTALQYRTLHAHIDTLLHAKPGSPLSLPEMILADPEITKHFFEYAANAYSGKSDLKALHWYIPQKKIDPVGLLNSFIARGGNTEGWEPLNIYYIGLKKELVRYFDINKAGGWGEILPGTSTYRLGDTAALIGQVKQRLRITGEFQSADMSAAYTPDLLPVIKKMQKSYGFTEDGIINKALVTELNVSAEDRVTQIRVNLERMRWIPQNPSGTLLVANVPEFRLHAFEDMKKVFSMDIVVGKEAHSTVIFSDLLQYVVFSPYWNIPPSIVRNEILPAIRRNRNYLSKMNMERTGSTGGLPVIRQRPGGANALGRVKFLFPNSYNIYFHDTPSKSLFTKEKRAFSHGCIRVAEPAKLAAYLLRFQPEWNEETIGKAMSAATEKTVTLKDPVPVFITYFTAWVDSEGQLNFRKDIYNHDQKTAEYLFTK